MKTWVFLAVLVSAVLAERIQVGKEEEVIIQSDNYPQPQGPDITKQWELVADKDLKIELECNDIRTNPSPDCEMGYVQVTNAAGEGKYCDSKHDLKAVSKDNTMKIELVLKRALGVFRCRAISVKNEDVTVQEPTKPGEVEIKVGDNAFELHLKDVKKGQKMNWSFKTDSNAKLSMFCTRVDIRAGGRNCDDMAYVKMTSGKKSFTFCRTGWNYDIFRSETNQMDLEVNAKAIDIDTLECVVQSITGTDVHQYKNIVSYEIDSREHGMTPGAKKTTCPCGTANKKKQTSRVIHGEKATPNEFPFVVSLQYTGYHICGGSIITQNHVLSAAHCTHNKLASNFKVLVGQNVNIKPFTGQLKQVVQIVDHENYNPQNSYINDITIMVIQDKFEFGQNVMPVCLPQPNQKIEINHKYVTLMGWGIAQDVGNKDRYIPTDLMKTHMRVVDYPVCNAIYSWVFSPTSNPNKFCTWASIRDSCSGDSGGPLVWLDPETNRYTQMGLVSFGRGCNTEWPKINTLVQHYYSWIQKTVQSTMTGQQTCEKA